MKAVWNGRTIAESPDTVVVEGNHYFPVESVNDEFLEPSQTTSTCPWKGTASYHSLCVDGSHPAVEFDKYLRRTNTVESKADHREHRHE